MEDDNGTVAVKTISIRVPIEKLRLDVDNARFIHLEEKLTEKKMEERIWAEGDTSNLYEQIKEAKGLYEPPIINSDFVVIEGNRRLVCLRHLQEKAKAGELPGIGKTQFDFVICKQIPRDVPVLDVDLYIAALHISGKKPWPLFNRAKRICAIRDTYNFSYDRLAKRLGMGKVTIIRMVDAYKQTLAYHERYSDEKDWYRRITYFDELYGRRGLKEFRSRQENIDKFMDWIHYGKFGDHRDVRALDRILNDPDARHAFETGSSKEALRTLEEKDPTMKSREFRQITKTMRVLSSFSRKELIKTVNDPHRIRILEALKEEIDSLLKDIKTLEGKSPKKLKDFESDSD